jgi:hypothetical protein
MREQVKEKLDELLDRCEKIMNKLSAQEKAEFRQAIMEEIE